MAVSAVRRRLRDAAEAWLAPRASDDLVARLEALDKEAERESDLGVATDSLRAAAAVARRRGLAWAEVRLRAAALAQGAAPRDLDAAAAAAARAPRGDNDAAHGVARRQALMAIFAAAAKAPRLEPLTAADLLTLDQPLPEGGDVAALTERAARLLDARALCALSRRRPDGAEVWLRRCVTVLRAQGNLAGAERLARRLNVIAPNNPAAQFEIIEIALRRGRRLAALRMMARGYGDSMSLGDAAFALKQMRPAPRLFILAAPFITVDCALRLWIGSHDWPRSRGLRGASLARVARAKGRDVAAAMNRIGLSNPLVLAEAATEIAGAMAIKRNPDAAIMLSVSRGFLMERTEAIRLFLEGQNDLLSGVWRYRDLCAPKPGMTPLNRAPDMVVTFMPISTTLETRAPLLRKRRNELRFGRRAPRETADAVREARETMPALNSQADYESAFMARRMSILATPMLAEAGADPTVVACVDNVIRLTLEDRLYGFVKQRRGVLMHVADCKARTVVVVISKARVLQGMEIAELLSLEGLNTFVTFDALTRDDCNQVTSALTGVGSGDRSAFLASLARMKFEAGPASRLPVAQRFAAPVVKLPPGDETLVIAGLADPSYITATQSLSEALARFGHVTVFDGSEKGRDKVRAADVELVDAPSLGETVDSGAVDGALRAMIAEMERGETNGSTDPKALVWLAASFSRLISAGRTGLLQELSNVAALRSLLATGRYRAIVTVPGRMACARAATIMARAMKLPSIDVQAFFISKHPRYYPSLADMYCGVTDDQVEDYRSHNPDPAQEIVCIGSLMIDRRMHNVSQMDRAAARKQLGLPLDRAILLYCAQHGGDREDNEAILMSARAAQGIPNALAVVKLHPRVAESAVETTRAILSSENLEDVKVSRNADVYALIRAADVVVTRFSNVGLEAAVMGRPVISVNTTGADYIVDPARMGVALRATSKEELAEHVRKLMTDPEAKKALERSRENYFARNPALIDSTAAENFAAIYRKAIGAPS